jgi:hypothetical protein
MTEERHLSNGSPIEAPSYSKIQIEKHNEVESSCGYTFPGASFTPD